MSLTKYSMNWKLNSTQFDKFTSFGKLTRFIFFHIFRPGLWFSPLSFKISFPLTHYLKNTVKFRKYAPPNISPTQTRNAKNPRLNRPSEYTPPPPPPVPPPPGDLHLELSSNTKQNKAKTVNFLPTIRLARSILKLKFPSVDKPLRI